MLRYRSTFDVDDLHLQLLNLINSNKEETNQYFEKLSKNGHVHMPLAEYPFSEKFGWFDDQFGVSWQLNLEKNN